jgi:hypothetical protein
VDIEMLSDTVADLDFETLYWGVSSSKSGIKKGIDPAALLDALDPQER